MPENIERMLEDWSGAERTAMEHAQDALPPGAAEALREIRGDDRPGVAARLTIARWAPLAAAVLLTAALAALVTRQSNVNMASVTDAPEAERAGSFTLIGLMRANRGYSSDDLVLPDADVVSWVSRAPALQ